MAMHVDTKLLLAITCRLLDRHREFLGDRSFGGCSGVLVQGVGAAGLAGVQHRIDPLFDLFSFDVVVGNELGIPGMFSGQERNELFL